MTPIISRTFSACRREERATLKYAASSRSEGSFVPGLRTPSLNICWKRRINRCVRSSLLSRVGPEAPVVVGFLGMSHIVSRLVVQSQGSRVIHTVINGRTDLEMEFFGIPMKSKPLLLICAGTRDVPD